MTGKLLELSWHMDYFRLYVRIRQRLYVGYQQSFLVFHRPNIGHCHLVSIKRKPWQSLNSKIIQTNKKKKTRRLWCKWIICYFVLRMPFDVHTPVRFGAILAIEFSLCSIYMLMSMGFLMFYISVCTHFWPCITDLTSIIGRLNGNIKRSISTKLIFAEFINMHLQLYK